MARTPRVLLALLLLLLLLAGGLAGWLVWRTRRALPAYEGEVRLAGLAQPVRVLRDERAVPYIYAASLDDLLFAQGYIHAQERLWQMDILRRTARGELAEVLGPALLNVDKDYRLLGLGAVADRAVESLDPDTRHQLQAYARGVNAYIDSHPGTPLLSRLPVEFALLNYRPEPWQPADSFAIGLHMYRVLSTSWPSDLARMRVEERVGPERAADLYVARSDQDHPIAEPVAGPRRPRRQRVFVAGVCRHSLQELLAGRAEPALESLAASNNWAVGGARTASGAAMLANDMHLAHGAPSIWFMNRLQAPELDVIGFSVPGIPLVAAGHNGRIAWGLTVLPVDTQDLFIERFDPDDPSRYMTPTGWQPVGRRLEHIRVRWGEDVNLDVVETRHGPIVHDDGKLKLALQWTARDPALLSWPTLAINRAQTWEEFT
ncbi:MAG: penicillin acylase family protein, partial [Acidobacteria bacterium]|nr:penicillin acylase family protein [Acidobacteriota bacterium]